MTNRRKHSYYDKPVSPKPYRLSYICGTCGTVDAANHRAPPSGWVKSHKVWICAKCVKRRIEGL